jgi:hypothetical protein
MFADFELSARLEQAEGASCASFASTRARIQPETGSTSIRIAGAYVVYDGPTSPITQTFGLGMFGPVSAQNLDAIEAFFKERDAPVFHEASPHAGVELFAALANRGYKPVELTSVMYRDLKFSGPGEGNVHVREIRDNERKLWAQVMAQGWAETAELTPFLLELGTVMAEKENTQAFLAEIDGAPVATASISLEAGVALLAGASTIPQARRQGAQAALLGTRLRYAAEHYCDLAMMCAAPGSSSQRNAERNGFRIAYTRVKWALI